MSTNGLDEYWVPEHVKDYLRKLGFVLPLDDMEPWIRSWDDWMSARGEFYDYRDKDGMGRVYAVHRRSIHPAMRVCKEWGSLLLNEEVKVVCDNQKATDWINTFFSSTNFMNAAQATVVRAFGLGAGAWALWLDLDRRKVRIRHYDARMVIPLSWDEDGISECAFVTRAFYRGKAVDQLQMHLRGGVGFSADLSPSAPFHENEEALLAHESEETYRIVTVCFDHEGNELAPAGILPIYDTSCPFPTFGIVKPAIANTRVDMSPYGQSVFADAVDAVQAVDLTFDALINEIDLSKMRVFLSDVLFDREQDGNKNVTIPFGKQDCTVFRKVMSTEDTIQEVRAGAARQRADRGFPRCPADAWRPDRFRHQLLRHGRVPGVREDGHRGELGQFRTYAQHPPAREQPGGLDRLDGKGSHARVAILRRGHP